MKKRIFVLLVCICFMLCAVACGTEEAVSSGSDNGVSSIQQESDDSSKDTTTSSAFGSLLVDSTTSSAVNSSSQSSTTSSKVSSSSAISSSATSSSVTSSEEETKVPEWKLHPENYKLIAFTFDDAPNTGNPDNTSDPNVKIVNAFKKYEGAGTLFVTGTNANSKGFKLLQYAVNCGFELGNHTYTHPDWNGLTEKYSSCTPETYYNEQIKPLNELIYNNVKTADGKTPYTIRFARSSNLFMSDPIKQASEQCNMPLIGRQKGNGEMDGSVDNEAYIRNVLNNVSDGSIVLMHTWSTKSADTIDAVLSALYNDGYRFCTLSELFEYKLGVTDLSKIDVAASCNVAPSSGGIGHISEVKLH